MQLRTEYLETSAFTGKPPNKEGARTNNKYHFYIQLLDWHFHGVMETILENSTFFFQDATLDYGQTLTVIWSKY